MKNIVAINGSPKPGNSVSGGFIDIMTEISSHNISTIKVSDLLKSPEPDGREMRQIIEADIIVFVFSLYIDCLHSQLIEALTILEDNLKELKTDQPIYAIVNNGFIDAKQNESALEIIAHFCKKAHLNWRYGVAIGGGTMFAEMPKKASEKVYADVFHALQTLAKDFDRPSEKPENIYITPRFPKFLFRLAANRHWKVSIKKNSPTAQRTAKPF